MKLKVPAVLKENRGISVLEKFGIADSKKSVYSIENEKLGFQMS